MTTRTLSLFTASTALVLAVGCSSSPSHSTAEPPAVAVQTVAVAMQGVEQPFTTGGVVRARTVAVISSHIMAVVRSVNVSPGERVKAGQTLVVLEGRDLQANRSRAVAGEAGARQGAIMAEADRQAAAAGYALASATHTRMAELKARNSATQGELDQAVAGLRAAESRLRAAEARVSAAKLEIDAATAGVSAADTMAGWATLTAPFDGVVTEKQVEVGNMVAPGQMVVTVEDTTGFQIETRIDESRAALVHVGDTVTASLTVPGQTAETSVQAKVTEIARMFSPETHDYLVKLSLPTDPTLRSGIYGRVRFSGPTRQALAVPSTALVRRGQLTYVYVVERDNRVHLRLVDSGESEAGIVEIRAGLVAGDRVVGTPSLALADGAAVTTGGR